MRHTGATGRGPATGADVTSTESSSVSDGLLQAHDQEARLLAELLRTSRLALLFGPVGSDKTALLQNDLMPLMRRRAVDQATSALVRETRVVVPFQDRRSRDAIRASKRKREVIVYFDDWADAPLAALQTRIRQAVAAPEPARTAPRVSLRDTLNVLSNRLNATIIILLDRFEELLKTPLDRPGSPEFIDELVEAINEASLSANFLIALDQAASPKLASLRSRIPGFDDFSLKLTGLRVPTPVVPNAKVLAASCPVAVGILPVLNEAVSDHCAAAGPPSKSLGVASKRPVVSRPKAKLPAPSRTVLKTDDVYELIQATLARTATQGIAESATPGGDAAQPHRTRSPVVLAPVRRPLGPRPAQPSLRRPLAETPTKPVSRVGTKARAPKRGMTLKQMVEWVARRLRRRPGI